jgi:hypothetical protein
MFIPRSKRNPRYRFASQGRYAEFESMGREWTARKTLIFVTGASCLLYGIIMYAAIRSL